MDIYLVKFVPVEVPGKVTAGIRARLSEGILEKTSGMGPEVFTRKTSGTITGGISGKVLGNI